MSHRKFQFHQVDLGDFKQTSPSVLIFAEVSHQGRRHQSLIGYPLDLLFLVNMFISPCFIYFVNVSCNAGLVSHGLSIHPILEPLLPVFLAHLCYRAKSIFPLLLLHAIGTLVVTSLYN